MQELWTIVLATGIPSTITGIVITVIVKKFIGKQEDKEKAREEINVLLIQGIGASISLGEANTLALKNGKTNGETDRALKYAVDTKHNLTNFLTRKGIQNII